jgi:hypothetical protein
MSTDCSCRQDGRPSGGAGRHGPEARAGGHGDDILVGGDAEMAVGRMAGRAICCAPEFETTAWLGS